uniref:Deoxyuridine 5'-triphosphate nucleotidohydrolase n=1 Tax=Paramormyrops kingsleyae TaxID=1676925 RepID=A0A3B3QHG0_9TELE
SNRWFRNLRNHTTLRPPPSSAGLDLFCVEAAVLLPHTVTKINTGIGVQCPMGHCGQFAFNIVLAGVIDSDHQGFIQMVFENISNESLTVENHDRIAQLLVKPVHIGTVVDIPRPRHVTQRGEGGFGPTAVSGAKV